MPHAPAPFYIVPMFPYPSGKLHMGHVRNYAISDAIARHYRRQGRQVLHPIGWDAYGLPAENAARATGADPRAWTDQNIAHMRAQLDEMGFEFTPGHEVSTHDPAYVALGQRLFIQMFRAGLIERRVGEVWWDPVDHTVLANEQVIDGKGWRSGAIVARRQLSMLFARTTDRAHVLAAGLEGLSWPSQAKAAQHAWIMEDDQVRLRDWCLSRQRAWGTPVPLVECTHCGEVPADEATLPWPNLPTHATVSDRACSCPACGRSALRSDETLDTFWDSSFYTCVYPDAQDNRPTQVAGPAFQKHGRVDLYVGGLEHATMHLLYARWFAWAMRQVGYDVPEEPFTRLVGQGMVCAPAFRSSSGQWVPADQVREVAPKQWVDTQDQPVTCVGSVKMSKSKGNGVDPGQQVAQYGAEAVRFAMLFAAPYAVEIDWQPNVVNTAARHVERLISQAAVIASAPAGSPDPALDQQAVTLRQQAVASFEGMVGVNAMMGQALGLWRAAYRAARTGEGQSARATATAVADALWPIVPHTIERVMATINPAWLPGPIQPQVVEASRAMVFQVNGVRRASIPAAVSSPEQALDWMYEHHPEVVAQYLSNGVERWIFVPGRVVNAVVKPAPPRLLA